MQAVARLRIESCTMQINTVFLYYCTLLTSKSNIMVTSCHKAYSV